MTFKAQVANGVANAVSEIEERAGAIVDRVDDAREKVSGWGVEARRVVRANPGLAIAGAFALGVVVAKLARRHA